MWKNIKNVASTVANLSIIAGKEIHHQVTKASNATESVTAKMEAKQKNFVSPTRSILLSPEFPKLYNYVNCRSLI